MGAKDEAQAWAEAVQAIAKERDLKYDVVGGLNPKGAPAALCPGGTNRLTGKLTDDFWGASCDADEAEEGSLFGGKAVLPGAIIAKAHVPDLAEAMPPFNVESLERNATDLVERHSRKRVEFESIDFNKRFLTTVPADHDPIALREMFSPGFLEWVTTIDREIDFGVSERQLYFHWRLRERSQEEYELALKNGGQLFKRVCAEVEEEGVHTYRPGPWHAGLEPFPTEPA
jgi:hypothetical protein